MELTELPTTAVASGPVAGETPGSANSPDPETGDFGDGFGVGKTPPASGGSGSGVGARNWSRISVVGGGANEGSWGCTAAYVEAQLYKLADIVPEKKQRSLNYQGNEAEGT